MTESDQEFISVPVPREHVTKVYAYLARLSGTASSPEESGVAEVDGNVDVEAEADGKYPYADWAVDDFRALVETQMASVRMVAGMLDILAEQPGEYVSYSSLVARLGVERKQLQGSLAAFTRHIHKVYRRRNWPMTWVERLSSHPDWKTEFFYQVDKEVAERWKEVRA